MRSATILVATSITSVAIALVSVTIAVTHAPIDPCGLPPGLSSSDSTLVARAMACRDVEHGRISRADYHALVIPIAPPVIVAAPPPTPQWASSVRAVSSEWSASSWSAQQVLGAPDVYPAYGDQPKAWASKDPDAPTEFIEVGFAQPTRASGMQIVQTFNLGAVSTVELVTLSGKRIQVAGASNTYGNGSTATLGAIQFACTDEPIVGAKITLQSSAVPGWNEIDAIGLIDCR